MKNKLLFLLVLVTAWIRPQSVAAQDLLFPKVAGWNLTVEETVYNPSNLFDVIDGAADLFLEYHFVNLHIARYEKSPLEIKVELYKHGSSVDAFGIYSQERFADYHFIDIGVQGYLEKGALNFLSGIYYVKISTIQEASAAQDAMLLIASSVNSHLRQSRTWPVLLAAFPDENKKANSEQYISTSFLGYSALNAVFAASYDDGTPFRAFVMKYATPQEALKSLNSFLKALPQGVKRKEENGKQGIEDPNNGWLEVIQRGTYVYGAVSPETGKRHNDFLERFGKNLQSLK